MGHWIKHNIHSAIAGPLLKKLFVLSERNDRINQIDINLYKKNHHNNNKKKKTNTHKEEKENRNRRQYANAD